MPNFFKSKLFGLLILPLATLGLGLLLSRWTGGHFLFLPLLAFGCWSWGSGEKKTPPGPPKA